MKNVYLIIFNFQRRQSNRLCAKHFFNPPKYTISNTVSNHVHNVLTWNIIHSFYDKLKYNHKVFCYNDFQQYKDNL
jgi:hypothetical protein